MSTWRAEHAVFIVASRKDLYRIFIDMLFIIAKFVSIPGSHQRERKTKLYIMKYKKKGTNDNVVKSQSPRA